MSKRFILYVPGAYHFRERFYPRIKKAGLDCFEADAYRWGIQRQESNILVVFLERSLHKGSSHYTHGEEIGRFALETPQEQEIFQKVLGGQKEVSVFSLFYTPRMTPLAWRTMVAIADDPQILVRDDSRHYLTGPDCVLELKGLMV